ncbi:MAG: hypothetical protein WD971_00655 [Pirellulales bacterium]
MQRISFTNVLSWSPLVRGLAAIASLIVVSPAICHAQLPAFPGAVGQGALATGGRGGDVYHVTSLLDYKSSQPTIVGSLRHAVASASGPRTIVFDVGGSLKLERSLSINKDNLTIAGQTAPTGVTVWGYPTSISGADDVVVRHLRFRTGDFNVMTANPDGSPTNPIGGNGNMDLLGDNADGVNVANLANRVILDHVSASWSLDETLSVTRSRNITVQHSMIAASLNSSLHHKGEHGYGSLVRGEVTATDQTAGDGGYTFYGNLWAHHDARNPSFGGQQTLDAGQPESERRRINVNLVNSVIFNWDSNATHRNNDGDVYANIVGNYYVNGPLSNSTRFFSASGPGNTFIYQQGNYHDRDQDDLHDGFLVDTPAEITTAFSNFEAGDTLNSTGGGVPYNFFSWVQDAVLSGQQAYEMVVEGVGASLWRDVIDQRVLDELAARTGGIINSQDVYRDAFGILPGIDDLATASRPLDWDTDSDGMPNWFEMANGLNAGSAADRNTTTLSPMGYTNLEVYLAAAAAGAVPPAPLAGDYNNDQVVDAADYTVWRDSLATTTPLVNETASLGTVDAADYDAWKANFGTVAAGAASRVAGTDAKRWSDPGSSAVPEPATLLVIWVGLLTVGAALRWERSRGA